MKIPIEPPESFFATIRKANAEGVKVITIPAKICEFVGLQEGDKLKVWIKPIKEE